MMYESCAYCGKEKTGGQRRNSRCMSCAKLDANRSPEYRANISAANLGKVLGPQSLETRRNNSLAHGGDGDILNRKYPGLQRWARLVKARDSHKCAECDYQGRKGDGFMDAHHVVAKAAYPELATVLFNGVTLCKPCHKEIHAA